MKKRDWVKKRFSHSEKSWFKADLYAQGYMDAMEEAMNVVRLESDLSMIKLIMECKFVDAQQVPLEIKREKKGDD